MHKYTKTYTVILDDMDVRKHRLRPISAVMYLQDTFARYCATRRMAAYDLMLKDPIQPHGRAGVGRELRAVELPFFKLGLDGKSGAAASAPRRRSPAFPNELRSSVS